MPDLHVAYFAQSLRSDWNNGNAHFLRGLMRAMGALGHDVRVFEPESGWSIENLRMEVRGKSSLAEFARIYPDLNIEAYSDAEAREPWRERLNGTEIVILHEWNPPALAQRLLSLRDKLGFRLLFHDTHHRASSSPEQIEQFGLHRFDGILAFGAALRSIYRQRFSISRVWILHEAADTTVFFPQDGASKTRDAVWIGNWGDDERSAEIKEFFLKPAAALADLAKFGIFGVRYPEEGLRALREANVCYGGYLPNLEATSVYAGSRLTVHIPRQQYTSAMTGIPTIRVFEALACGIPLISAPWRDIEQLFRPGDFSFAQNSWETISAMRRLLECPSAASEQAQCGLETVLARHTCNHRAQELTGICKELLA
jgi:spore maturation protein CgeB